MFLSGGHCGRRLEPAIPLQALISRTLNGNRAVPVPFVPGYGRSPKRYGWPKTQPIGHHISRRKIPAEKPSVLRAAFATVSYRQLCKVGQHTFEFAAGAPAATITNAGGEDEYLAKQRCHSGRASLIDIRRKKTRSQNYKWPRYTEHASAGSEHFFSA